MIHKNYNSFSMKIKKNKSFNKNLICSNIWMKVNINNYSKKVNLNAQIFNGKNKLKYILKNKKILILLTFTMMCCWQKKFNQRKKSTLKKNNLYQLNKNSNKVDKNIK